MVQSVSTVNMVLMSAIWMLSTIAQSINWITIRHYIFRSYIVLNRQIRHNRMSKVYAISNNWWLPLNYLPQIVCWCQQFRLQSIGKLRQEWWWSKTTFGIGQKNRITSTTSQLRSVGDHQWRTISDEKLMNDNGDLLIIDILIRLSDRSRKWSFESCLWELPRNW